MKTFILYLLFIVPFISCKSGKITDNKENPKQTIILNHDGVYRSTEESFQADFYLIIEGEQATIYGWEAFNESDTIYYRSISTLGGYWDDKFSIRLDTFEQTRTKNHYFQFERFYLG